MDGLGKPHGPGGFHGFLVLHSFGSTAFPFRRGTSLQRSRRPVAALAERHQLRPMELEHHARSVRSTVGERSEVGTQEVFQ